MVVQRHSEKGHEKREETSGGGPSERRGKELIYLCWESWNWTEGGDEAVEKRKGPILDGQRIPIGGGKNGGLWDGRKRGQGKKPPKKRGWLKPHQGSNLTKEFKKADGYKSLQTWVAQPWMASNCKNKNERDVLFPGRVENAEERKVGYRIASFLGHYRTKSRWVKQKENSWMSYEIEGSRGGGA